ncbi:hypothetical protein [Desulfotomaculum nigrificans]|uniref:hypothetical protein n=1 Tax=Desulfotomaculum nigrificans TaxID=1565 RepID=UPI001FA773F6|nr:hypothetical protein [Desulfotomaculum nigrificans]
MPFYGVHPTNVIPVSGILPRDKDKMLKVLEHGIQNFDEEVLAKTFKRTSL